MSEQTRPLPKTPERTALVAGGAGAVGEGIVTAFLGAGWRVIVPSRSQQRLDALRERLHNPARLVTILGDVGTPEAASETRKAVRSAGGALHAVVGSIGGWRSGPLLTEQSIDDWNAILTGNLTSHLVLAQTFLPQLGAGGAYTVIVGDTADSPSRGAGAVSVAAAGVLMLTRALALENAGRGVRVNALVLGPVKTRRQSGRYDWITAEEVGETAVFLSSPAGRGITGSAIQMLHKPPAQ